MLRIKMECDIRALDQNHQVTLVLVYPRTTVTPPPVLTLILWHYSLWPLPGHWGLCCWPSTGILPSHHAHRLNNMHVWMNTECQAKHNMIFTVRKSFSKAWEDQGASTVEFHPNCSREIPLCKFCLGGISKFWQLDKTGILHTKKGKCIHKTKKFR